ncbi:hypothetical protein KM043_010915 [Ampulex compressa]|nr:hypothetical protein KM043_010915 [Ampulex compressa]
MALGNALTEYLAGCQGREAGCPWSPWEASHARSVEYSHHVLQVRLLVANNYVNYRYLGLCRTPPAHVSASHVVLRLRGVGEGSERKSFVAFDDLDVKYYRSIRYGLMSNEKE